MRSSFNVVTYHFHSVPTASWGWFETVSGSNCKRLLICSHAFRVAMPQECEGCRSYWAKFNTKLWLAKFKHHILWSLKLVYIPHHLITVSGGCYTLPMGAPFEVGCDPEHPLVWNCQDMENIQPWRCTVSLCRGCRFCPLGHPTGTLS